MTSLLSVAADYVAEEEPGFWRIAGTRVSLASIVWMYREGASPESILRDFPSLSLEQIYGAIAFYLRNRQHVDMAMESLQAREDSMRRECEFRNREFRDRILSRAQRRAEGDSGE